MTISTDFTSATTGDEITIRRGYASLSGTFVATLQLQRYAKGGWQKVAEYTEPTEVTIEEGINMRYRWECTAYTSGTAATEISGTTAR